MKCEVCQHEGKVEDDGSWTGMMLIGLDGATIWCCNCGTLFIRKGEHAGQKIIPALVRRSHSDGHKAEA